MGFIQLRVGDLGAREVRAEESSRVFPSVSIDSKDSVSKDWAEGFLSSFSYRKVFELQSENSLNVLRLNSKNRSSSGHLSLECPTVFLMPAVDSFHKFVLFACSDHFHYHADTKESMRN